MFGYVRRSESGLICRFVFRLMRVDWFIRRLVVSLIFNICDIAGITINSIVDHLTTTIRENNIILSLCFFTVAVFVVAKVDVRIIVLYRISKIVFSRSLY